VQEIQNLKTLELDDVYDEAIITIRCLSAIPEEVELLLAELASKEEESQD